MYLVIFPLCLFLSVVSLSVSGLSLSVWLSVSASVTHTLSVSLSLSLLPVVVSVVLYNINSQSQFIQRMWLLSLHLTSKAYGCTLQVCCDSHWVCWLPQAEM